MMNQLDPEDLNREVRELRIEQLKDEAEALSGKPLTYKPDDLPLAIEETFWRNVVAFEQMARKNTSLFDTIHQEGTPFPAPESLDDEQIHTGLWVLVTVLSNFRVYLEHTDHLSDRELYSELWRSTLREVDDSERLQWAKDWPEFEMPESNPLPYDRDRLLPTPQE